MDRLFVSQGLLRVVLYDARPGSETFGQVDELTIGTVRPALVVIPPKVWHGVQNASEQWLKLQYYRLYVLPFKMPS